MSINQQPTLMLEDSVQKKASVDLKIYENPFKRDFEL
jgi:hypothetical protein